MSSLFEKPVAPAPTPIPTMEPARAIPIKNDAASRRARKRSLAERSKTGGKQSTILTGGDKLGG